MLCAVVGRLGVVMPSLNITFSDEEHQQITDAARRSGSSLKAFVTTAALKESSDYTRRVAELSAQVADWSQELNTRLA